ncbi:MAG: dipeptide ABC transporter ATP-binding protein [Acidimicrobiaceae bacterium]|nr:dipeptide ABC transporter ATP-binding protein [Acidimicrobiaceae bacterium]
MGLTRFREQLRPATLVLAFVGLLMLVLVLGAAVFADVLSVHPPDRSTGSPYEAPSSEHLLGTDDLGRDLWSQLVYGARVSLLVGLVAAVVATGFGTAAALVAGWHRGWVDAVIMRVVDLTLSLPFLVLVLVLAAYFGRGLDVLIVLIAGVLWARPARLLRGQVLKIREFGHTEAAHAMGAGSTRIMTVHILWRLIPLLVSQFVRAAAVAVIVQSGVAFLGLGDPGRISWGSTLYFANNGSAILTDAWLWWIVPPGVALTVLIVGLAFVGFAFEELADPQLGGHGWRPPSRRRLPEAVPDPCAPEVRLDVRAMTVDFNGATVVREAGVRVGRGRVLGLVGESGSGKSTLGLSVPGLVPHPGVIRAEAVMLGDVDLRRLGRRGLERIRGRDVAIVPQAAMSVLDPTMTVLDQVAESAALASGAAAAAERAGDLLSEVGLPPDRHRAFPHELSGGQRQRVVIAMAVANRPELLIADEPTTGLDVVTQQAILDLLDDLRRRLDFDLWLISHDLPLVASRADDLVVMYGGRVVESGPARAVISRPQHPYTSMLLGAFPSLGAATARLRPVPGEVSDPKELPPGCAFAPRCPHSRGECDRVVPAERPVQGVMVACHHAPVGSSSEDASGPEDDMAAASSSGASTTTREAHRMALRLDDVRVVYPGRRRGRPDVTALDGVSLEIGAGESVAIIGRSAAGKSTIARLALGLAGPTSGSVELLGEQTADLSKRDLSALRRRAQMVFQDPYESLHPNMTVEGLVGEPLAIAGTGRHERAARVAEALEVLGLVPVERFLNRHAGTLSGGQRQRVALARTLVASPELIVADEPASMLDASLRATVAAHLLAVRQTLGATLVFITHDISLARLVADRIVVLFEGRVVEDGPAARLLAAPGHAETQALIDAAVRGQVSDSEGVAVDNAPIERSGR